MLQSGTMAFMFPKALTGMRLDYLTFTSGLNYAITVSGTSSNGKVHTSKSVDWGKSIMPKHFPQGE